MKKLLFLLAYLSMAFSINAQTLVSATFIQSFTKIELDSAINNNGIPASIVGTQFGVDIYKVIYNTVSWDSTATIASGMIAFPHDFNCRLPLVSYQHSPETRKTKVPSRLFGPEPLIVLTLASNGYVACAPDYLGLGDSPGFHPFLHAQSEATVVIDMIRAARELSDSLKVRLNSEIFLSGYSQGGHATVAAHQMIQEKLAGEMQVTASYPMSGPYDMSGAMFNAMFNDTSYPAPAFVAALFVTYNKIYGLYDSLSKPLISPLDSLLPPVFDGVQSLWVAENYINGPANSIFKPDTLAAMLADTNHPFRVALRKNDVNNWAPSTRVKMFFCSADTYVPPANSTETFFKMMALGNAVCDTQNASTMLNHEGCSQFAILAAKLAIDEATTIDCSTAINETQLNSISIAPNPSADLIHINYGSAVVNRFKIFSADGRLVMSESSAPSAINISWFADGLYLLLINGNNGQNFTARFLKCAK